MRLKLLLLLILAAILIVDVQSARDRKKNRNRAKNDDPAVADEDEGMKAGSGFSEEKRKETKDRVMALVERGRDEKHEKKEEESSEEKDEDTDKKSNGTEIEIPKRFRRTHELSKARELNDGELKPLDKKPTQTHQCGPDCQHGRRLRLRRDHELKKTEEINDGAQTPLDNKPTQTHKCDGNCQHRLRLRRARVLKRQEEANEDATEKAGKLEHHAARRYSRVRREPTKQETHGHRKSTHPHGKRDQHRHLRGTEEDPALRRRIRAVLERSMSEQMKDLQSPEGKQFTYAHKYVRTHGKPPPPIDRNQRETKMLPIDERDKDQKSENRDNTLVAADAAEIRENY